MQKSSSTTWVAGTLCISLILRWILVLQGGQYYFSDEERYETSRLFAEQLLQGKIMEAFSQFFIAPEHLGFKIIGILPALVEQFTGESLVIPALFFSLFSTLNLFILYKISRQVRASETESLYALVLAALSMSLLYYSRHLMPYDPAMSFGLLALYTALTQKPNRKTSLACGALSFACFITYNGYWSLAGLALLVHILGNNVSFFEFLRKGLIASIGFAIPFIVLFFVALAFGTNLLTEYRTFATTVSQGSYAEGWGLPFEYFWHTEHILFIVLCALSMFAGMHAFKQKDNSSILWTVSIAFLYLCLAVPSVFLHSFVVYGRLARQILPFLILLSASGLTRLERHFSWGQKIVRATLAIIIVQAAWNYKTSFDVSYPREFAWEAQTLQPDFHFSEKRLAFGAPTLCHNNGFIIENAKRFVEPPVPNPLIQGELLLSALYSDNFIPYQYEGYTSEQRQAFRDHQPEMRFYKVDNGFASDTNPVWATMKNCMVGEN